MPTMGQKRKTVFAKAIAKEKVDEEQQLSGRNRELLSENIKAVCDW